MLTKCIENVNTLKCLTTSGHRFVTVHASYIIVLPINSKEQIKGTSRHSSLDMPPKLNVLFNRMFLFNLSKQNLPPVVYWEVTSVCCRVRLSLLLVCYNAIKNVYMCC